MATQKERSSSNGSPSTTPTPPPASGLQTEEGTATRPRATSSETPANQATAFEKFFSFMSYEQHQQGAPAQSNNSNNNNATPMSLDGSSYARGNQQQPTFALYEPQRGSVSFMPRQQPSPDQEKALDALQVQSQFAHVLKLQTSRPFDGNDFFTWSFEFVLMMEGAQILGFFDGSLPYPTHGTQYDKQQYTYQSMMAYTILLRNVTPNQQQNIRSYRGYGNSAELAYNHLKNLYQATDSVNRSRLMAQLTTVEMKPGEKGMAYISRCRELRDKLLRCGGSISEDAFVRVIIGGLGPQWRSTRAILRAHGKISEAALCAEIHAEQQDMDLQEERHKKKASVPEFAFHTQQRYNNNNYRHQPKTLPPFCHLCKTSGHPPVDFDVWLDDLQLFLQCDSKDGLSLFDLTSGASTAPTADADSTVHSQWLTRDAAARLAVRSHLPSTERAHFSQYKSAKTLYDAVVARYSSPATAALSRLMLPYLFPDLAAFATVTDLITHLRTSDTRYRAALPAEFCAKNPPPMYINLYYLVTRLPDTLRSVRDHFLSLCPTTLTVDLLEERLLAAETSITSVEASRGDPPRGAATARASGARVRAEVPREAVVAVEAEEGVGVGVVAEVGASVAAVEVEAAVAVAVGVEEAVAAAAEVELVEGCGGAGPCAYVLRTGDRTGEQCGGLHATQRCFGRLTDAWCAQFPDATEIPRWHDLLRSGVAVFDFDFDAILAAMYAVSISAEGDCYVYVPPDPGIEAATLGASESAAPGARESAAPGAGECALSGTSSAQVLHTFTLDSGASRSFFRDCTTLTPLSRPVAVSLADPSGGPVFSRYSTVLSCPAAPSGSLSGLYLPSFSTNLVSGADLQDAGVDQFTPASQRVTHCTCAQTGRHLATFTRRPGSSLYTLTTESPPVAASGQLAASSQTLLWHHRLGNPSLPRLRGMASRVLVSSLPRSLPPLPPGPAPTCVPCVEGRLRATPHSFEFPPTEAPLQTLHMDVWGPARVRGQGHERYFLLVVGDYSRYTTVFPLRRKDEVTEVLIDRIRVARLQLRERFGSDFLFCICTPTVQNGIAEHRIGMVMDVDRTSMIHATAPHFLWPFTVQYAAHQINLQPRVSLPETSPTLRWTGKVGDASAFRVWGSRAFVRDLSADKLSSRAVPCVFLGFPPDALGWQFYHPTSRRVLSSQDVTFDESVPYYHAVEPVKVAVDSGTHGGAEPGGAEPGGAEPRVAESGGAVPAGGGPGGSSGALSRRELPSPQELRSASIGGAGATCPGGARTGGTGAAGPSGATGAVATGGAGARGAPGVGANGGAGAGAAESAGGTRAGGAAGSGAPVGAGVGAPGVAGGTSSAGGAAGVGADARGAGVVPAGSGGAARPRPYFIPLLEQVLGLPPSPGPAPSLECPPPVQSESQLQLASPLPAPSPYAGPTGGLAERREPESRPASPVRTARTSRRVPRQRPPAVPGTHQMALRPSTASQRVPLPSPLASSLPALADPESDSLGAACPTVMRFLATVVTDPSFESTAASALVAELVDFAAHCRLDYATSLVAESASVCPPSVGGECARSTDVLEDRQEEFQCFAAALPHLVSTLLAPEGDPDAPDIPTPRSYAEAIEGTYVNEVPPPGANIVSGMWIFRVKRSPGSPPVFKARYVARGFSQRQGVDYFQTFSPTPKMTTLRVLLHVAAHHDYAITSGMGLVLGGWSPVVLTGHADASWVDDLATQRSSQGYTFSLSSCEAEIYAGAMAAQELRWLTYLLTDLGEPPRSPPVLYVDNKAMLALCREHRPEHRTKHIALRYFLARELQQRGQLRLTYVASQANTADIFTKALQPCDHQRFYTMLACFPV
ncbi:unnamed protein product [Closterium sp. NIES-53]